MRGLKKSIKCMMCRHRKVCHAELSEIARLQWINRELTAEIDEYEKELQKVQNERDRLEREIAQLKYGI